MNKTVNWQWCRKAGLVLQTLANLHPDEFYDEGAERYHTVHEDIVGLASAIPTGSEAWGAFLKANPLPRETWLPASPSKIDDMDLLEVCWRLVETIADERMWDASTAEVFESGSLTRALERMKAEGEQLDLNHSHDNGTN